MTEQNQPDHDEEAANRKETRMMWIFSGAIVLLILGAMGANVMFHKEKPMTDTDVSAQSKPAPTH